MDNKILKYKDKKNKLERKIINLLNTKKLNYENDIINSNNSDLIIGQIENYLKEFNKIPTKKLLITINGIYSVGKTTFINHLEDCIKKISNFVLDKSIINIKKILFCDIDDNIDIINNIIIVESDINEPNIFNTLYNFINKMTGIYKNDINIINVNILPKNKSSLKNKYINKIIFDIKNNTSNFLLKLNLNNDEDSITIQNHINLLKLKNEIYLDIDFIFLDEIINNLYDTKQNNLITDENESLNIIKYYL